MSTDRSRFGRAVRIAAAAAFAGLLGPSAFAEEAVLHLDADQVRRLGVEFSRPRLSDVISVATGPAEVVIPPVQQSVLSTPVTGLLAALNVAEGDSVERGEAVAEILSADYMEMQRQYLDASALEQLAEAQLRRDEGLYADGIIADRRLQETRAAAQSAALASAQARQQLQIAGFDRRALDRLDTQRELTSTLTLTAPAAGVAIEIYAGVGMSLDSLAPVARLADLDELWLEARLPQEVALRLDDSMRVRVSGDDDHLIGPIITVGRVADMETQTVLVRAAIDNSAGQLLAGQFLTVEVVADSGGRPALAVPSGAITREGTETYVFVSTPEGVAPTRVGVLAEGSHETFIQSGLAADDRIAVAGISALKALWLAESE